MKIERATPVNEFLAKLIFLMLPTAAISYFLLYNVNVHYAILQNESVQHTLYLAAGMGISALLYSFRIRFWPTYAALIFMFFSLYAGIDRLAVGEFDAFFIARKFQVFAILFSFGWFVGWGYTRLRYFAVMISAALLTDCIALIATSKVDTVESLLYAFLPAVVYVVYNIFTAEQIYNYKDKTGKFWWYLSRRLAIFGLLVGIVLGSVVFLMLGNMKETVAQYGGGGKKGANSMMKQNKDGTFDLNNYTKLSTSLNRDKELLFCAHIDNYFPGTTSPNPLYLTAFYFTKFDTTTETFEKDKIIPSNDLFQPDPSKIPLFSTKIDTMVVHNSMGDLARDVVNVEIYNCKLSPSTYLAPNIGYFVQPITVEKDFREKFISAYRTKSYVSTLNSAYFVYNMDTPVIRKFQEERFKLLRQVKDYKGVDSVFFKYYTRMPGSDKYKFIAELAHKITDSARLPVDKVIAIRNYFLSKNENGEHLYKYTDNPGEPDIPNASKLMYFLNESHKGYCAYYAGATLFMLRALGIPSRISVGFLTQDRSDKNKGWYWYYANQAHAWNQVFFPGYGWLDFDFTVGNTDEARPTPQPDGTPPMQPPKAWLALDGTVESTDTAKKLMQLSVKHFVFHDKEYTLSAPVSMTMDMKVAAVYRDSQVLSLQRIQKGDDGTAVSYAEDMKLMSVIEGEKSATLIGRMPSPVPIDEVYLKNKLKEQEKEKEKKAVVEQKISATQLLWIAIGAGLGIVALIVSLPQWVLLYFRRRYKNAPAAGNKAYWAYRTACYYMHMVGVTKGTLTPMQYARQVVDPYFGTSFTAFMNVYLKKKYAQQELNEREQAVVDAFLQPFLTTVKQKVKPTERIVGFLNTVRMAAFFTAPEDDEKGV